MIDSICCLFPLAASIAVVGCAVYAKRYHQHISARRATIDFTAGAEATSQEFTNAKRVFGQVSKGGPEAFKTLWDATDEDAWKQRSQITMYLNHYELVAIAIESGALDESMYENWNRTAFVQTWKRAQEHIASVRRKKDHPTYLEHFERLAKKWDD